MKLRIIKLEKPVVGFDPDDPRHKALKEAHIAIDSQDRVVKHHEESTQNPPRPATKEELEQAELV